MDKVMDQRMKGRMCRGEEDGVPYECFSGRHDLWGGKIVTPAASRVDKVLIFQSRGDQIGL